MRRGQLLSLVLAGLLLSGCGAAAQGAQVLALNTEGLLTVRRAVRSLAVGAPSAGAEQELWLADERGVWAVGSDGVATEAWKPPRFARVLRLEAGDITGDGASEWVITLVGARVRSLVLGFRDGAWVELAPGRPGFLRPAQGPEGTPILLGQAAGSEEPYSGPIRRVRLEGGALVDDSALDLPPAVSIHDVFWLRGPDGPRLFTLESTGHLGERDMRSPRALIWRSDARSVSRPISIDREYSNLLNEQLDSTLDLAVPPTVIDVDGDGVDEVLLVSGTTTPVAILDNVRVLQGADARLMGQSNRGLEERHRSPLLGRAMVGVVPWAPSGGPPVWVGAVWTRPEGGFAPAETRLYLFDPTNGDLLAGQVPSAW